MQGKTHMAVGIAASLLLMQPANMQELILGTGAAAVGSVIPDIDIGTSESHREADKITAMAAAAVLAVAAAEYIWHLGIYKKLEQSSSLARILGAAAAFLLICAFGRKQPHRSFMHSILALFLLECCVDVFLPAMVPYFGTAFLSHLAADLLNRKGERLLYPLKARFSLGLCASDGLVNGWLFGIGSVLAAGTFAFLAAEISRLPS